MEADREQTEIGVLDYLDRALGGPYANFVTTYRLGLLRDRPGEQQPVSNRFRASFHGSAGRSVAEMKPEPSRVQCANPKTIFEFVRVRICRKGLFSDPWYGGNRNKAGWRLLGHPGVWLEKQCRRKSLRGVGRQGRVIQSLADIELRTRKSFSMATMIRSTARLHHEPTPTSFWSEWDRWDRSSRRSSQKPDSK